MVNKRIKKLTGLIGREGSLPPSVRRKVIGRNRVRRRKLPSYKAKSLRGLSKAEKSAVVQRRRSMIQQVVDKTFRKKNIKKTKPDYLNKPTRGYYKALSDEDKMIRRNLSQVSSYRLRQAYRSDYSLTTTLAEFAKSKRQRPLSFTEWSRLYGKGKGKDAYVKYTENFYSKNPSFRPKPKPKTSKQIGVGGEPQAVTPTTPKNQYFRKLDNSVSQIPTDTPRQGYYNPNNRKAVPGVGSSSDGKGYYRQYKKGSAKVIDVNGTVKPKRKKKLDKALDSFRGSIKNAGGQLKGLSKRNKLLLGGGVLGATALGIGGVMAYRKATRDERDEEYKKTLRETYSRSPYYGTSVDRNIRRVSKSTESARNLGSTARAVAYTADTFKRLSGR